MTVLSLIAAAVTMMPATWANAAPSADVDVFSPEYPPYEPNFTPSTVPAGTPGRFTIDAKGNTDVVGFYVDVANDTPRQYVPADAPGGSATVTLIPVRSGPGYVFVQTVDAAGNRSATIDSDYGFFATAPTGPHTHRGEFNADGATDVVGLTPDGRAYLHLGDGAGGWLTTTRVQIDSNRVGYDLFRGGTWDDDGWNDLLAVNGVGHLVYFTGNGAGDYSDYAIDVATDTDPGTPTVGWGSYELVFSPGDFDGDTRPDIIARDASGSLYLFRGDGYGNLRDGGARTLVSRGWGAFDAVFGPGDVDGDTKADLVARQSNGDLYLFPGKGDGSVGSRIRVGAGWNRFAMLFSPGDWNGDGKVDLMGVLSNGDLHVYHGTHTAPYFVHEGVIGTGWTEFDRLL